jgi:hypothetical protein
MKKEKLDITEMLHVRVTKNEKSIIENNTMKYNFRSVSEYLRFLALNEWNIEVKNDKKS